MFVFKVPPRLMATYWIIQIQNMALEGYFGTGWPGPLLSPPQGKAYLIASFCSSLNASSANSTRNILTGQRAPDATLPTI